MELLSESTVGLLSDCRTTVGLSEYCRILSDKPVGLSDRGSGANRGLQEPSFRVTVVLPLSISLYLRVRTVFMSERSLRS